MIELLDRIAQQSTLPQTDSIITAMIVSVLTSVMLYIAYQFFYRRRFAGARVDRAFLMVGPVTTALFIGIQFSLPLSLGLLGALSFIRFRTPVRDPEEAGYVLALIGISISIATFNYLLVVALLVTIAVILVAKRWIFETRFDYEARQGHLFVHGESGRFAANDLEQVLGDRLPGVRLLNASNEEGVQRLHFVFSAGKQLSVNDLSVVADMTGVSYVNLVVDGQAS